MQLPQQQDLIHLLNLVSADFLDIIEIVWHLQIFTLENKVVDLEKNFMDQNLCASIYPFMRNCLQGVESSQIANVKKNHKNSRTK